MKRPDATQGFLLTFRRLARDADQPIPEYRFHPPRRWRFDAAWPERLLAVEIEGGAWASGRHVRGTGYEGDCEKYNQAACDGWIVLRYTPQMINRNPLGVIEQIKLLLEFRP